MTDDTTQPEDLFDPDNVDTDQAEPTTNTNYPPKPNPMNGGKNPYPRPETGPNWPLIRATRNLIASLPNNTEAIEPAENIDPNGWSQGTWRCGTGMCYAGWASALTGATFPYSADEAQGAPITDTGGYTVFVPAAVVVRDSIGKDRRISEYARHMLGLGYEDSDLLFAGGNTLTDIDDVIAGINVDE
jgi:hypothetical protein